MHKQWCSLLVLLAWCGVVASAGVSGVTLKDSGYEGVVVAIEEDLPVSICQEVLVGLEVSLSYLIRVYANIIAIFLLAILTVLCLN